MLFTHPNKYTPLYPNLVQRSQNTKLRPWNKSIIDYNHHFITSFQEFYNLAQFCGILPTFLCLESHQGKIISHVTVIWRPQWVFISMWPQRNVSNSTEYLGQVHDSFKHLGYLKRVFMLNLNRSASWTRSICWNFLVHNNFMKIFIWLFIKWKNVQSSSLEEAMVTHVLHNWQSKGWQSHTWPIMEFTITRSEIIYHQMLCTTGSPRDGGSRQDSKNKFLDQLFRWMAVHYQLEFNTTLGIDEAECSKIYLHVLQH